MKSSVLAVRVRSRMTQEHRRLRPVVQVVFLLLVLAIGGQFYLFVRQLERGLEPTVGRPAGVEAFLPISALISLKYWLLTGVFNRIHPSGLALLLIIGGLSLLLKRAFCSWVCPFGLLGDVLEKIHRLVLRRRLSLPRLVDYPLRSLKYLLLLFFLWAIFVRMDVGQLGRFINSPYNRIADVKMLKFFTAASPTTIATVAVLVGLSLLVPFFWCRYLCPYGALLGALSVLSPFKIRRDGKRCVGCQKCTQVCPARVRVHRTAVVRSDECHACLRCVDVCPVDRTLCLSAPRGWVRLSKLAAAAAIVLLFGGGVFVAQLSGHWRNAISPAEYRFHLARLDHPAYQHQRGTVPTYDWDELGIPEAAAAAGRTRRAAGR
jgi:polyferredoxin